MKIEPITYSITRITNCIYNMPYDNLSDYLKGVRDIINLINAEESSKEIADYIQKECKK